MGILPISLEDFNIHAALNIQVSRMLLYVYYYMIHFDNYFPVVSNLFLAEKFKSNVYKQNYPWHVHVIKNLSLGLSFYKFYFADFYLTLGLFMGVHTSSVVESTFSAISFALG